MPLASTHSYSLSLHKTKIWLQRLIISSMLLSLTACSLLDVNIASNVEPLTKDQINMRVFSRDFSGDFYATVEQTADNIYHASVTNTGETKLTSAQQLTIHQSTLLWKIHAEQTLQQTIFQTSPVSAMIDTWIFTAQMRNYFDTGAGKEQFLDQTPKAAKASGQLLNEFEDTIKGFVAEEEFTKNKAFVDDYAQKHPLLDLGLRRKSAFKDWLAFRGIQPDQAVSTFGSASEVVADMSERMGMISDQMPKILAWKGELYSLYSDVSSEDVRKTLEDITATSATFRQMMIDSPELVQQISKNMSIEMSLLLDQLSEQTDEKLDQLSVEREEIRKIIISEREQLDLMMTRQLEAGAVKVDKITQNAVKQVFVEITTMIKSLIIYFILFLIVVFFAPLGLGVWLGKRMEVKKQRKNDLLPKASGPKE